MSSSSHMCSSSFPALMIRGEEASIISWPNDLIYLLRKRRKQNNFSLSKTFGISDCEMIRAVDFPHLQEREASPRRPSIHPTVLRGQ